MADGGDAQCSDWAVKIIIDNITASRICEMECH